MKNNRMKIKKFLKNNTGLVMVFFLFIGIFLILSPVFEFPLNDSWGYSKTVKDFSETKEIRLSEWTAASFVFQMFYGYLFTLPFGFSFTALRISTIVMSFFGVVAFYFILKEFKFSETISTLGSLLLFFNPLYFNLSYTFMTDIPLISLVLISTLFYIKALKTNNLWFFSLGSVFSILAVLVRQNAILLPSAVLIYLFITRNKEKFNIKTILVNLWPFAALVLFQLWYSLIHGAGERFSFVSEGFFGMFNLFRIAAFSLISIFCIGFLFFLFSPLFAANIRKFKKLTKEKYFVFFGVIISIILILSFSVYVFLMKNFPFLGYQGFIINNFGLGPKLLAGIPQMIPNFILYIISVFVIISSLMFLIILIYEFFYKKSFDSKSLKRLKLKKENLNLFLIIILILQFLFVITKYSIFDRYLLILIPFLIVLLFSFMKEFKILNVKYLYIIIIATALFSVVGTQDYINYNKASWYGSTQLLQQDVSPKQIDGGFEFNGWYNFEYALENLDKIKEKDENKITKLLGLKSYSEHLTKEDAVSWWFVVDDKYIISFSELDGYETIKGIEYKSYLFPGKQYVYVLERK